ncbi:MAG: ribokinase, partial [Actinobacteria bacterium]|nr:ribokinase [Actinomycetota bacterium]
MQHRVVVVGSANVDYSVRVDAFPHAGETRLGDSLHRRPGGKGLNQAIAAARFGAEVSFVGSVGADADGELLARTLHEEGIDASHLTVDRQARTGFASIYVAPDGQNSIVVAPGANSLVAPPTAAAAIRACARRGDVVVVQAEVPIAVLADVVDTAAERHLRTV